MPGDLFFILLIILTVSSVVIGEISGSSILSLSRLIIGPVFRVTDDFYVEPSV